MPIVDVELKRDLPRARRGYVKYAATAIAAVLFLHGAATFALHHRLHGQGHGRHHSIDGEPTPTSSYCQASPLVARPTTLCYYPYGGERVGKREKTVRQQLMETHESHAQVASSRMP